LHKRKRFHSREKPVIAVCIGNMSSLAEESFTTTTGGSKGASGAMLPKLPTIFFVMQKAAFG